MLKIRKVMKRALQILKKRFLLILLISFGLTAPQFLYYKEMFSFEGLVSLFFEIYIVLAILMSFLFIALDRE